MCKNSFEIKRINSILSMIKLKNNIIAILYCSRYTRLSLFIIANNELFYLNFNNVVGKNVSFFFFCVLSNNNLNIYNFVC